MFTMNHPNTRKSLTAAAKMQLSQAATLANIHTAVMLEPGRPDPATLAILRDAIQAAKEQAERLEWLANGRE